MRMSMTFAVSTYAGGLLRIVSIFVFPSLRSFLSCARLTRTSFALLRASIRWSRERTGACACVLVGLMAGGEHTNLPAHIKRCLLPLFPGFLPDRPRLPERQRRLRHRRRRARRAPGRARPG